MPEVWTYEGCELVRVIDGDTLVAKGFRDLDVGFHITIRAAWQQRFRLDGIACGKLFTPVGNEAADVVKMLLALPFKIESLGPYKYGDEWMGRVTLATGQDLATMLVKHGLAVPWNGRGTQPVPVWPVVDSSDSL